MDRGSETKLQMGENLDFYCSALRVNTLQASDANTRTDYLSSPNGLSVDHTPRLSELK